MITGDPGCQLDFSSFLAWTPSNPGGTAYPPLPSTQLMNDAFSGETTINYATFKHHPWKRDFRNVTIENRASRPGFQAPSGVQGRQANGASARRRPRDKPKSRTTPDRRAPGSH